MRDARRKDTKRERESFYQFSNYIRCGILKGSSCQDIVSYLFHNLKEQPPNHNTTTTTTAAMFRSRNSYEHPVLKQFLETVDSARAASDPKLLSNCLNLAPDFLLQNTSMLTLVAEIRHLPNLKLAVEEVLGTAWPGFVDLTTAYLEYAASIDLAMMSDVKPMLVWFGNMEKFMGYANSSL